VLEIRIAAKYHLNRSGRHENSDFSKSRSNRSVRDIGDRFERPFLKIQTVPKGPRVRPSERASPQRSRLFVGLILRVYFFHLYPG
jgi:hypothetical protein